MGEFGMGKLKVREVKKKVRKGKKWEGKKS
jgi:hypothetical protein